MNQTQDASPETAERGRITGLTLVAVYVDDYERALTFYRDLLGLEKTGDMGPSACYFRITDEVGLYLEGGNAPLAVTPKSVRASFGLTTSSVAATFGHLRDAGVRLVHEAGPQSMGGDQAWFQCYDPAGNIIEIVGTL